MPVDKMAVSQISFAFRPLGQCLLVKMTLHQNDCWQNDFGKNAQKLILLSSQKINCQGQTL
jgi:hypothetical protein